ncbi:ABC transporter permease [Phytoactinopolyspora halophila]|nr:ABC transporter permease [Phytoactinopolyspora halophila]
MRLAVAGGRTAWGLAAVTTAAVAVGTALLLLALSAVPAMQARADRTAWMDSYDWAKEADDSESYTLVDVVEDNYHQADIDVVSMAGVGTDAPVPPGIDSLPREGEVVVSPALAELMMRAPVLGDRYGDVVGEVGDDALAGPDHLLAIRGVSSDEARLFGLPVVEFDHHGEVVQLEGVLRLLIVLGGVALLAPIALFVAMITRLSAASRDRRLAALRLAGATARQVRQLAMVETLIAGAGGLVLGVGLFFTARPLAAHITYDGGRWFPTDLDPSVAGYIIVVVGVPAVTATASQVALARVARSPLMVSRRADRKPVTAYRVIPLAVAVLGLGLLLTTGTAQDIAGSRGEITAAAFLILLLALTLAGPWFTRGVGLLMTRSSKPALLLAGRRLSNDPRAGFRAVGGVILTVLITTMFVATTPAAAASLRDTEVIGQRTGTVHVSLPTSTIAETEVTIDELESVDGVDSPTPVYEALAQTGQDAVKVWIGDCSAVVAAGRLDGVPCDQASVIVADDQRELIDNPDGVVELHSLSPATPVSNTTAPDEDQIETATVRVDDAAIMPSHEGVDMPAVIVTPDALGSVLPQLRPTLLLARYHSVDALEAVRTTVLRRAPDADVSTRETSYEGFSGSVRQLYQTLTIATVAVFLVAGCGLIVAVTIGLLERRRPFALLRAAGTPLPTLRRTLFLEAAAPLTVMSVISALLGIIIGHFIVDAGGNLASLPWGHLLLPVLAGLVFTMTVVGIALPAVNKITAVEQTRFE